MKADRNRSGSLLFLFTCISTATVVCRILRPLRFLLTKYAFAFWPSAVVVYNEFSRCLGLNMVLGSDKFPSGSVLKVAILQQTVYYALFSCTIRWSLVDRKVVDQLKLEPFQASVRLGSLNCAPAETHLERSFKLSFFAIYNIYITILNLEKNKVLC